MRRSLATITSVATVACASGSPTLPVPERATCYMAEGRTWPLGDTSAVNAQGRTTLVLERGPLDVHGLGGAAWAVDDVPIFSRGSWRRITDDSLSIQLANSFNVVTLQVWADGAKLIGSASGSTDENTQAPDGSVHGYDHAWSVSLRRVNCPRRLRVPT